MAVAWCLEMRLSASQLQVATPLLVMIKAEINGVLSGELTAIPDDEPEEG